MALAPGARTHPFWQCAGGWEPAARAGVAGAGSLRHTAPGSELRCRAGHSDLPPEAACGAKPSHPRVGGHRGARHHLRAVAGAALRRHFQLRPLWTHWRRPRRQSTRHHTLRVWERSFPAAGLLAWRTLSLWAGMAAALQRPDAPCPDARRWIGRLCGPLQAARAGGTPRQRCAYLADPLADRAVPPPAGDAGLRLESTLPAGVLR